MISYQWSELSFQFADYSLPFTDHSKKAPHFPTSPIPHFPTSPIPHFPNPPLPQSPTSPIPHFPLPTSLLPAFKQDLTLLAQTGQKMIVSDIGIIWLRKKCLPLPLAGPKIFLSISKTDWLSAVGRDFSRLEEPQTKKIKTIKRIASLLSVRRF